MPSKKEPLRAKAEARLAEDLEARKVQAIARLLNDKRRKLAEIETIKSEIAAIEAEIVGIEKSPSDTSFITEGESFRI